MMTLASVTGTTPVRWPMATDVHCMVWVAHVQSKSAEGRVAHIHERLYRSCFLDYVSLTTDTRGTVKRNEGILPERKSVLRSVRHAPHKHTAKCLGMCKCRRGKSAS